MDDEINELIAEWKAQLTELRNFDPMAIEGQKNIVRRYLIERFIEQLRYLRDEV